MEPNDNPNAAAADTDAKPLSELQKLEYLFLAVKRDLRAATVWKAAHDAASQNLNGKISKLTVEMNRIEGQIAALERQATAA